MSKRLFTERLFEMEKNAFLLDVIQTRASAIIQADSQSNSLSETALVLGVNTAYIEFVLKMRDNNPGVDFESLCQLIYDKIYEEDWKRTSRFKEFDINLLRMWCDLKVRERELREGHIALDSILADAKHAYWAVHNKDIEWKEIEEKTEQLKQEQETEPETEETPEQVQARVDMGKAMREWVADERREERLETLFELVQDGTMNAGNAFEYVPSDYGLDFDSFLRMQEAWEEEKKNDDSDD